MIEVDWARYAACNRCEAEEGAACINLLRKDRCPRVKPHYGRRRKLRPYRNPRQGSRLLEICVGVMEAAGKRPSDLAEGLGWHHKHIYRVFNETQRPMTLLQAERILAVLGHRLEHRAVPIPAGEEQ